MVPTSDLLHYFILLFSLLVIALVVCGAIVLVSLPKDLTGAGWRNLMRLTAIFSIYIVGGFAALWAIFSGAESITVGMLRGIPPMMCIFYGLAQLHASYISLPVLKYLGIWLIICGIAGAFLPDFAWLLWAIGFGLGHIAIGIVVLRNKQH